MIRLHGPAGDTADRAALQRRVLAAGGLVLAPRARVDIERGRVSTATLRLLLDTAEVGGPLLVFEARGRRVRLQATTHVGTRRTMIALHGLPTDERPTMRLEPIPADFADAHTGPRETRSSGALGVQAARLATRYLGVPYVWGGASPAVVDCSGLTMLVYAELGVPLDHYAAFQFLEGRPHRPGRAPAGDLVFFNMKADGPGHMGLYLGDDRFIHAPRRGDVVKVSLLSERAGSYVGAVRPY
jgi:cell wall-associated NlpC family hydrolase